LINFTLWGKQCAAAWSRRLGWRLCFSRRSIWPSRCCWCQRISAASCIHPHCAPTIYFHSAEINFKTLKLHNKTSQSLQYYLRNLRNDSVKSLHRYPGIRTKCIKYRPHLVQKYKIRSDEKFKCEWFTCFLVFSDTPLWLPVERSALPDWKKWLRAPPMTKSGTSAVAMLLNTFSRDRAANQKFDLVKHWFKYLQKSIRLKRRLSNLNLK
jgi:hypothetical protein